MISRTAISALAATGAATAAVLAFAAPLSAQSPDRTMTEGEQELAEILEGRVAGEPVSCIQSRPIRSTKIIDDTAIVFRSAGKVYVNYTQDPRGLDDDDYLVIRRLGGVNLCRSASVTTEQRPTGFYTGNVLLTDFIPYERIEDAD